MTSTTWHDVGEPDDFSDDAGWPVVAGGRPIAIFRQGEEIFALHDLCTHGAARLSDGWVEGGEVECPLHQGTFDIRTGAACKAPCSEPVRAYPIRIVGGRVEVEVEVV